MNGQARSSADVREVDQDLCEVVLTRIDVSAGVRLLDVGCGPGSFCSLVAARGATISGIDESPSLITRAGERIPQGDFHLGAAEELPFEDETFDIVTGLNSLQYAARPLLALQEMRRVVGSAGLVVVASWSRPQECDAAAYLAALQALLPPGVPEPFALSDDGALASLVKQAGLDPLDAEDVHSESDYPDEASALRGLLCHAHAERAIKAAGEQQVREAVRQAIAPFRQADGHYRMLNAFRLIFARRSDYAGPTASLYRPAGAAATSARDRAGSTVPHFFQRGLGSFLIRIGIPGFAILGVVASFPLSWLNQSRFGLHSFTASALSFAIPLSFSFTFGFIVMLPLIAFIARMVPNMAVDHPGVSDKIVSLSDGMVGRVWLIYAAVTAACLIWLLTLMNVHASVDAEKITYAHFLESHFILLTQITQVDAERGSLDRAGRPDIKALNLLLADNTVVRLDFGDMGDSILPFERELVVAAHLTRFCGGASPYCYMR